MRERQITCCFSGSRPEKIGFDYIREPWQLEALRRDVRQAIIRAAEDGFTDFISGMSRGFDLWAAMEVLNLRQQYSLRLLCAIPYPAQAQGWEDEWRTLYSFVSREADELHVISQKYFSGCFQKRNRFMVDHAGRLICWDCGGQGGTRNTVDYARFQYCQIENLASAYICR